MEMHLVHHNEKYRDLKEALDKPDGIAVFGIFFELDPYHGQVKWMEGALEHPILCDVR